MSLLKNLTLTAPAVGNRLITLETVGGAQWVTLYRLTDDQGGNHAVSFSVAEVLAAHPEIDGPTFGATLAIFRAHGDAACGFTSQ